MDITEVILHQHAEQRRMFSMLEEWPRDDEDGLDEIRDAIRSVRRCKAGSDKWWEAVVEANVANSDHMAEEERQDLTDFRQQTTLALRHGIAVQFLRFEAEHWATGVTPVDKDPEEFVEQNEPS
jgi:valyl-tRNA synthetase